MRTLTALGDIRPGEGRTASLMFAAVFCVMCAYYMVKPLREGWIATSAIAGLSRVEIKAYSSLVQSLLLMGAVGAYARLAARCSRRVLITRTSLVCTVMLLAFWVAQPGFLLPTLPGVGIAFYLWVGMFGVFIVAQFWAFATDLYSDERGRRLLPLIAIGGTAGAAVGSWVHGCLTAWCSGGGRAVLLAATLPLLAATALSRSAAGHTPVRIATPRAARRATMRRVLSDRFVLAAGMLALLLSWASTNGENLMFQVVQNGIAEASAASVDLMSAASVDPMSVASIDPISAAEHARAATTAYYGDFYFWTNLAALAAQLLLTSRLLKRGGLAAIIFALPMLALLASAVAALAPALAVLKWVKVAEQATDYSLNQTARQVLWLPASAEVKYESKPTVDALFVRIGDGLAALTVLAGTHLAGQSTDLLIAVNVVLVALWLVTAMVVVREHGHLVAARAAELQARLVPALRRARHACARRFRRVVRAVRAQAVPWPVPRAVLDLLPIGRGHPPPMLASAALC